jgi:hypothetical protein
MTDKGEKRGYLIHAPRGRGVVSAAAAQRLRKFRHYLVKMRQQLILDSRFGQSLGVGTLFWPQDPKVLPSPRYAFTLSVSFVAMPLTHYVITEANRTLDISYTNSTSIIELPLGNHSIDEMVEVLNRRLLEGFKAAYLENTDTLRFSSESIGSDRTRHDLRRSPRGTRRRHERHGVLLRAGRSKCGGNSELLHTL